MFTVKSRMAQFMRRFHKPVPPALSRAKEAHTDMINFGNLWAALQAVETEVKSAAQPVVDIALNAGKQDVLTAQQSALDGALKAHSVPDEIASALLQSIEAPLLNWTIKL